MYKYVKISIIVFCAINEAAFQKHRENVRLFPKGFQFGAATGSYQIEGAWNADGKSESIWDHVTHNDPCFTADCSNGDIANDSYEQFRRDVEMARELGLHFYRFSITWTRVLPTSFPDKVNNAGVQYYNSLIDELLKYNIAPVVTLYHWDLPQKLQDMGGWANPYIVEWYGDYVSIIFELFGDRVKNWITINEPHIICYLGYAKGVFAPAIPENGIAQYLCAKNILLAHANAYRIYDEEFRSKQNGQIGITLDAQWYEPATSNIEDAEAARDYHSFTLQLYANPIFSIKGDFPTAAKDRIATKSSAQGFFRSKLPEFSPEEIEFVRGTSDFFGLNHYTSYLVYRNRSVVGYYNSPSFDDDLGVLSYQLDEWKIGESGYMKAVPWGFYKLLMQIKDDYNNPTVIVTENGFATREGVQDDERVLYYRLYLDAMLDAVDGGCNVRAYTAWSLMDNFEWAQGYTERFGLYEVDYSSPGRTRTPRKSAFVYKEIIRTGSLNFTYEPDDISAINIDPGH